MPKTAHLPSGPDTSENEAWATGDTATLPAPEVPAIPAAAESSAEPPSPQTDSGSKLPADQESGGFEDAARPDGEAAETLAITDSAQGDAASAVADEAPAEPVVEAACADPAAVTAEPAPPGDSQAKPAGRPEAGADEADGASEPVRPVRGVLRPLVSLLEILDLPFVFLSPGTKRFLGHVALATLVVAAAVWLAGPRLMAR